MRAQLFCAALALVGCGPGNVAPGDDDASGDDDAVTGDDDAGDDDAAMGGTGTISVTVEVLAVLPEGQVVEPEIVVALAPFSDFISEVEINGTILPFSDASEGYATGRTPPADIVVTAGQRYVVALKANEPDVPVEQRFVAAPHEVSVTRDEAVACPMFLGRDLTGTWQKVEQNGEPPLFDDPFEVAMEFGETVTGTSSTYSPCPTGIWTWPLGPLCLIAGDRVWAEYDDGLAVHAVNGTITDGGTRITRETNFPAFPDEPADTEVHARVE